jgi:hypothetical protein
MTTDQFRFLCACVLSSSAEPPATTVADVKGYYNALSGSDWQTAFPVLSDATADAPAVLAPDVLKSLESFPAIAGQIAAILAAMQPAGRGPIPSP